MPTPKSDERALSTVEKERRCLELRAKCWNFDDIAKEVGYSGRSGAYQATMRALKKTLQEPADELRTIEAERLDRLYKFTMQRIDKDNLWAVDRALKIMERRASLFGLDKQGEEDLGREAQRYLDLMDMARRDAEDLSER